MSQRAKVFFSDPKRRDKFIKVAGLLSSSEHGERAAAAARATHMLKTFGVTWAEALGETSTAHESGEPIDLKVLRQRNDRLFQENLALQQRLTALERELESTKSGPRPPLKTRINRFMDKLEATLTFDDWEKKFVASIREQSRLSKKQLEVIYRMADKANLECDLP